MRPQRKLMIVETTHAFVKLTETNQSCGSAGGINFGVRGCHQKCRIDPRAFDDCAIGPENMHIHETIFAPTELILLKRFDIRNAR